MTHLRQLNFTMLIAWMFTHYCVGHWQMQRLLSNGINAVSWCSRGRSTLMGPNDGKLEAIDGTRVHEASISANS